MMAHLKQMYRDDAISCMIDSKLRFTRNNQHLITGGRRDDINKEDKVSLCFVLCYYILLSFIIILIIIIL